ncbi:gamma-glutamyltranspeptidase/glutathione hydrolase [Pseudonocardia eucalypti]|uniref:gamma-glutamyltransferase n=1 Tax=Pseudonocardia eucalypti TaxID=648755 RepID=UPI0017EFDA65|nr:gamma-glutamyltranspeptidase/glutathione hydrolase [Pseudonocardia eucalypti]
MISGRLLVVAAVVGVALTACTSSSQQTGPAMRPEAVGDGGAVASIDPYASAIGLEVLRSGGNAVDAAVATAAALGVTEPYSTGIGGGGFFVYYDAASGKVSTLDGRETAPAAADANHFTENGQAINADEAMSSGLAVGVPGTPATWDEAARRWGTRPLAELLKPAAELARNGFVVDQAFRAQTEENAKRFARFPATAQLYLPGGQPPDVGTTLRNPDLAATYDRLGAKGVGAIYRGAIGADIVAAANAPRTEPGQGVRPGKLAPADLAGYQVIPRDPTHTTYRGLDVYGMGAPSSGGIGVAEALNILERTTPRGRSTDLLHRYLEATRLAFADRNRWVGDPAANEVPTAALLSKQFADSRACLIDPAHAARSPIGAGDPHAPASCVAPVTVAPAPGATEGRNTAHLTVADAKGNVVAYTLTIGKIGGSGMVVPGRGFFLTTVLTDFGFTPAIPGDPNLPGPGNRPRSSMSPTIVLDRGQPLLAVGSSGGTTILSTITQTLVNRLDLGMSLVDAIAAPRASQRNEPKTEAEPAFLAAQPERDELAARGHEFTEVEEFGSATGVERRPDGRWVAAAETARRGGGSAMAIDR